MTPKPVRRGPLAAAILLALGLLGVLAPVSIAASPSVAAPVATVSFLSSISFATTATLTTDVARIELVIDVEGSSRSEVADVHSTVRDGPASLAYVLQTPSGDLLPNTDVTARFRLTLADGTSIDGPATTVHYDDTRFAWKTIDGTYVRVHYTAGGTAFGQRAVTVADDAIRKVSTLLGVTENEPIDFYVYADRTAFYDVLGPGTRENVGGEARPEIRTLFANIDPSAVNDPWVGVVIPHELTHLVFDTAVRNDYHYPPRWLNEGIAVYESQGYVSSDRGAVANAASNGSIMPLDALAAQFPTTQDRFYLAYSESVSAVSFLVDHYGPDAMVALVRSYKGGVSDDEAFQAALHTDVAGFEAAWLASIGSRVPSPFGPKPAPAGPVPSGWGGAAPTAGTAPESSGVTGPAATKPGSGPLAGGSSDNGSSNTGATVALGILALAILLVVVGLRRRDVVARRTRSAGPEAIRDAESSTGPTWLGAIEAPARGDIDVPVLPDHPATGASPWARGSGQVDADATGMERPAPDADPASDHGPSTGAST